MRRLLCILLSVLVLPAGHAVGRGRDFTKLEGCRLVTEYPFDGDSFFVRDRNGELHKFRLYACDAPETVEGEPWAERRLREQAEYFGCTPDQARQTGMAATRFVRKTLADPFTVYTRGDDARGSGVPRSYAFVMTASGRYLSELLIENGLVRRYRWIPALERDDLIPNEGTPGTFQRKLKKFEKEARQAGRGGWAYVKGDE